MINKSNTNQIFQGTLNCTSKAIETDHDFPKQFVNLQKLFTRIDLIRWFTSLSFLKLSDVKGNVNIINKQVRKFYFFT